MYDMITGVLRLVGDRSNDPGTRRWKRMGYLLSRISQSRRLPLAVHQRSVWQPTSEKIVKYLLHSLYEYTIYVCMHAYIRMHAYMYDNSLLHSACYLRTTCLLSASFLRHFSVTVAGLSRFLSRFLEWGLYKYPE